MMNNKIDKCNNLLLSSCRSASTCRASLVLCCLVLSVSQSSWGNQFLCKSLWAMSLKCLRRGHSFDTWHVRCACMSAASLEHDTNDVWKFQICRLPRHIPSAWGWHQMPLHILHLWAHTPFHIFVRRCTYQQTNRTMYCSTIYTDSAQAPERTVHCSVLSQLWVHMVRLTDDFCTQVTDWKTGDVISLTAYFLRLRSKWAGDKEFTSISMLRSLGCLFKNHHNNMLTTSLQPVDTLWAPHERNP